MINVLKQFVKKHFIPRAVVLMYHRVAELPTDVWELAVSPSNFEAHLQVLQRRRMILPATQIAEGVNKRSLKFNSIAITFDDGYADNYLTAMPLLEKYHLPATFFIASGHIGTTNIFWWDELEHLILLTPELPPTFSMTIAGTEINADLEGEQHAGKVLLHAHKVWKATTEPPPTRRGALYYKIWEQMRPLSYSVQQQVLENIRAWAGTTPSAQATGHSMSVAQLQSLSVHPLFTVGAHSVSHLELPKQAVDVQQKELTENICFLSKTCRSNARLLAYPYGAHSEATEAVAAASGFAAAFNTQEQPVTPFSKPFSLPRFQVKNWSGAEFEKHLNAWLKS